MDQAASLRAWALDKAQGTRAQAALSASASGNTKLIVAGLDLASSPCTDQVYDRLLAWEHAGFQWVGQARDWNVVPLALNAETIDSAQSDCKHWAVWIDNDIQAFDKGYRALKLVYSLGGPRQLLALHEPGMRRKGLLDNLATIARAYFDTQLVVLAR